MYVDLSEHTGFHLEFDPLSLDLRFPEPMRFRKTQRTARDQQAVLYDPQAVSPDTPIYAMYYPQELPAEQQARLDDYALTYSFVLIPPLRIGPEFVKTSGHYHPPIPGTTQPYPEVYTQLYGSLYLLLQKRDPADLERIQDCRLVHMTPGYTLTLPPGYAHVLINATGEPALMAGLYGHEFSPNYAPIQARRGLAYYLLDGDHAPLIVPNPRYPETPNLGDLSALEGTPFEYDDPGVPLWSAFHAHPERYAFLTSPLEVVRRFAAKA